MTTLAPSPVKEDRASKWIDFGERVGWTAIQAAAGAVIVVLSTGVDWKQGLLFVGITTAGAVAKVAVAFRVGDENGALPLRTPSA
jgi:hypothetical protein